MMMMMMMIQHYALRPAKWRLRSSGHGSFAFAAVIHLQIA